MERLIILRMARADLKTVHLGVKMLTVEYVMGQEWILSHGNQAMWGMPSLGVIQIRKVRYVPIAQPGNGTNITSAHHVITNIFILQCSMKLMKSIKPNQLILLLIGVVSFLTVSIDTILLYSHYGPLTPNGNRYYHSFDIRSIDWFIILLELVAMTLLTFPNFRYVLSSNSQLRPFEIFPSRNGRTKWISLILTIFCVGSQLLFSFCFTQIVIKYLSNHSRVMADDLETILLSMAFIGCILFWGLINLIYSVNTTSNSN